MKLIRNVGAGAMAGAVGTLAMDVVWFGRYRRDGGKESLWRWESGSSIDSWEQASAPGQLGYKILRLVTGDEPPDEWARATTNLMHWMTGVGWGVQYGLLGSLSSGHRVLRAGALGPVAWLSSYVILPLAKVYKPIWQYDARTLAKDLSAHLVFGATTATAFAAQSRS
jgi:hypothetical protein